MNKLAHAADSLVAIPLVILLVWFVNPLHLWMTDAFHMTLLGLIVAAFAVFLIFLWKESPADERDQLHRFIAARFAYATAGILLLFGTVVQAFAHDIDPWLPLVLAGMVLAKVIGRAVANIRY